MSSLTRRAGLGAALVASVAALALIAAPAAWADPALTDTTSGSTTAATVGDSVSLAGTADDIDVWYDCASQTPTLVLGVPTSGCVAITPPPIGPYTVTGADLAANTPVDYIVVVETDPTTLNATLSNGLVVQPLPPPSAPQNVTPPSIGGSPNVGDTLTANPGTWTGTGITFAYTWYRCPSGDPCAAIETDATTYTLTPADDGAEILLELTATNGGGSATEYVGAGPITMVPPPPPPPPPPTPTNVTSPSIIGTPTDNSTLAAVTGLWKHATSRFYTWWRCDSAVSNCVWVATGGSYSLSKADLGAEILLIQTATDTTADGSTSASANSTPFGPITTPAGKVTPPAPPNAGTGKPGLSGTPQVGATVKAKPVTMANNPSYAYQWMRCAKTCTAINGATTPTYAPGAADLGDSLEFVEIGRNAGGATKVQSPQSAMVTAPTETTLQITPRTIVAGQPVTLIATVTSATAAAPPKGTITFERSGTPVQSCNSVPTQPSGAGATVTCRTRFGSTPSGLSAVFTPAAGSLVTGSDSASGGFVVGRAPTTARLKVPAHLTLGHRTTFVVRVHPAPGTKGIAPTGTVAFVDHAKPIKGCTTTLSGSTARCTVTYDALGTHAIAAEYLGDATFSGSSSRIHKTTVTVAKPKGYVSALMAWTFHYSPTSTRVAALRLTGLVPGVSVALACSGHGCPLHHHVYRMIKRACGKRRNCKPLDLAKRLHHARLGGGAKLTVRLTHRDWVGKYYRFVMRPGHKPRIVTSCLAVGVTQPNIACTPR